MADDIKPTEDTGPKTFSQVEMIDQALAPAVRIASGIGPVGHHELSAVVQSFRSALLAAISYDHDNPPTVEAPRVENKTTDAAMAAAAQDDLAAKTAAVEAEADKDPAIAEDVALAGGAAAVAAAETSAAESVFA